ncbi:MAG: hypothetical protein EYC70_01185 [Planctomycetota bacterium]|nr:MAG: hypothetical protein EYC70_01185 [Planctomycetota bacterium]
MVMIAPLLLFVVPVLQQVGGTWSTAWRFDGTALGDQYGHGLAGIQDLDGDGASELIVGAPFQDFTLGQEGSVSVYSGGTGAIIYSMVGAVHDATLGYDVAALSDLNVDGFQDFAAGALTEPPGGAVYVYSGADASVLWEWHSAEISAEFGKFVARAGDVDGDAIEDVLVGAGNSDLFFPGGGASFVYSGRTGAQLLILGTATAINAGSGDGLGDVNGDGVPDFAISDSYQGGSVIVFSGLNGSMIYRLFHVQTNDDFGRSVANVGDLDRDGVNDFVVGASSVQPIMRSGKAYVYSGAGGSLLFELEGDAVDHDYFGYDVGSAGDVNGDGYGDVVVGAPNGGVTRQGGLFIYSGINGRLLSRIVGQSAADFLGWSVASAPDINGDGLSDLLSFAFGGSYTGSQSGSVFVYELNSYLTVSPHEVDSSAGGTVTFTLDFPVTEAGERWRLLASADAPGEMARGGTYIPLVDSPAFRRMLMNPPGFFSSTEGVLDANGDAIATATLAPGQAAGMVGKMLRFAALSYGLPQNPRLGSAGVRITIVP